MEHTVTAIESRWNVGLVSANQDARVQIPVYAAKCYCKLINNTNCKSASQLCYVGVLFGSLSFASTSTFDPTSVAHFIGSLTYIVNLILSAHSLPSSIFLFPNFPPNNCHEQYSTFFFLAFSPFAAHYSP